MGKFFNSWILTAVLLALVVIAGVVFIVIKSNAGPGVVITLTPPRQIQADIYVGGAVNNPGLYPVYAGDTLDDIIGAAGGLQDGADAGMLELAVSYAVSDAQKIDINRAAVWLLEALPGVGEIKAQAIVDYRLQHGPFRDVNELLKVPGFGEGILSEIRDLITVYE